MLRKWLIGVALVTGVIAFFIFIPEIYRQWRDPTSPDGVTWSRSHKLSTYAWEIRCTGPNQVVVEREVKNWLRNHNLKEEEVGEGQPVQEGNKVSITLILPDRVRIRN